MHNNSVVFVMNENSALGCSAVTSIRGQTSFTDVAARTWMIHPRMNGEAVERCLRAGNIPRSRPLREPVGKCGVCVSVGDLVPVVS